MAEMVNDRFDDLLTGRDGPDREVRRQQEVGRDTHDIALLLPPGFRTTHLRQHANPS